MSHIVLTGYLYTPVSWNLWMLPGRRLAVLLEELDIDDDISTRDLHAVQGLFSRQPVDDFDN